MSRAAAGLLSAIAWLGCDGGDGPVPPGGPDASVDAPAGGETQTWALGAPRADGAPLVSELEVLAPATVTLAGLPDGEHLVRVETIELEGAPSVSAPWIVPTDVVPGGFLARSRRVSAPLEPIAIDGPAGSRVRLVLTIRAVPPDADIDRSLTWTDPAIVDDPAIVGPARVLAAWSDDGHGGLLLDRFLRTFGVTAHSERPALVELADAFARDFGADPASWDLDALPLRVTAVHNRIDLRNDAHCGELRVSFNVTDSEFPFVHFLFLFAQSRTDDVSELGIRHCEETAFRWAWLVSAPAGDFVETARGILGASLVRERFLLAESLERTVGTWEWRQWSPVDNADPATRDLLPRVLENPRLFQTLDVAAINGPGALRDDFLAWLAANADAAEARTIAVPERFAPLSARATEGVLSPELDLSGADPAVLARAEALVTALDRVGCPGCHARSETFVQTSPDRAFSPFYMDELVARRAALDAFRDASTATPPFGALSD
jgi:hypothetical protein